MSSCVPRIILLDGFNIKNRAGHLSLSEAEIAETAANSQECQGSVIKTDHMFASQATVDPKWMRSEAAEVSHNDEA